MKESNRIEWKTEDFIKWILVERDEIKLKIIKRVCVGRLHKMDVGGQKPENETKLKSLKLGFSGRLYKTNVTSCVIETEDE